MGDIFSVSWLLFFGLVVLLAWPLPQELERAPFLGLVMLLAWPFVLAWPLPLELEKAPFFETCWALGVAFCLGVAFASGA
jgi:hypothetical protein